MYNHTVTIISIQLLLSGGSIQPKAYVAGEHSGSYEPQGKTGGSCHAVDVSTMMQVSLRERPWPESSGLQR